MNMCFCYNVYIENTRCTLLFILVYIVSINSEIIVLNDVFCVLFFLCVGWDEITGILLCCSSFVVAAFGSDQVRVQNVSF